ncbi:aromatic acid decarboxylase, partial [Streptomyces sp. SID8455]|nr:aromatic acid decarboxylase [Streptomyces sp. SID8455]
GFSTVVGFEADLDAVELLFTSLLVQGTAAMTRAEAGQRASGRKRTKTFRQSFLMAYAQRLGSRLADTTERATAAADMDTDTDTETGAGTAEGTSGLLPVLAARDVAVTETAERMFPRTTTTRVRGATDLDGWNHGTEAADRARMGDHRKGPHGGPRDGEIMA